MTIFGLTRSLFMFVDSIEFDESWSDITPIPNPSDSVRCPFHVEHGGSYALAMEYFRAIVNSGELSQRALKLVSFLNTVSVSDPVPWWYRKKILMKIGFDFSKELDYVNQTIYKCIKPYQMWSHKQWLLEQTDEPPDETDFLQRTLISEPKNFHAWEYFYWFAERFGKHQWLFDMTTEQIYLNSNNNSAWSSRWAMLFKLGKQPKDDIDFALGYFVKSTEQCCASYIHGLIKKDNSLIPAVKESINTVLSKDEKNVVALTLLSQIADIEGDDALKQSTFEKLASIDTMRTNFWNLMKSDSSKFK